MKKQTSLIQGALLVFAGCALTLPLRAAITIHGSSTGYTTTDKDWLTHTANDIDGNGLGTSGFFFFGDFDGIAENNQPFTHNVQSLGSFVTSVATGANFLSVAAEYSNIAPGYGIIDDPILLDGTDGIGGVGLARLATGSPAGTTSEIMTFTVSGLTATMRVGVLSGTEQTADGRWDPTSLTLSDGIASATVGDHTTSPLPAIPDAITPNNVGWVFFDIDADGTYMVSGSQRLLGNQGVGIGGLTFDVIPEPTTSALFIVGSLLGLYARPRALRRPANGCTTETR